MAVKNILTILFAILSASTAYASRDVVEVSIDQKSDVSSQAKARGEIFEKAVEEVSKKYIQQIIGEAKYEKNRDVIKNKIIRQSGKYILYIKNLDSKSSEAGTSMTVKMKLSLQSLQKLLLEEGLLYRISGPPKILPVIQIQDRVNGASYSWWVDDSGKYSNFLKAQMDIVHRSLRNDLMEVGFYSLFPSGDGFKNTLPSVFRVENLPTEDEIFLGDYFDSQIIITGSILYKKSLRRAESFEIEIRLVARHTSNGRVIGEVIRSYQTEAGPMMRVISEKASEVFPMISKDLTTQVLDAWKSGTFGSTLIRLVVNGSLSFEKLKNFKDQFLNQVSGVKTLKERKFLPGQVIFEIDSDSTAAELSKNIASTQFQQFSVRVSDSSSKEIELKVSIR
ncbi:MAG: hypothetical protein KDD34_05380 [Bdellovibrionales bacterium]|nr:hypothetical protein [Bdellovibrionales bacterium]